MQAVKLFQILMNRLEWLQTALSVFRCELVVKKKHKIRE